MAMTPAPGVLALIRVYATAARRIRVLLRRALVERTMQHRRVQLALCRTILRQLRRDTPTVALATCLSALRAAVSLVDRAAGIERSLGGVQLAAARIGAENLSRPLLATVDRVGRNVDDVFRATGLIHATAQAITQASTEKAAEGLREDLERQGLTGFIDRAGRRWQLDIYARMVVRTLVSELQQRAVADRMIAHGLDLVTIPAHQHARDECSPFEGRVWSLTGEAEGYRKLPQLPPWHPSCSHRIVPARGAVAERAARLRMQPFLRR